MSRKNSIVGMGNPLVDIIVRVDDDFIKKLGFKKGSMNHVDLKRRDEILEKAKKYSVEKVTGGSVANTIIGLSELGISTSYIGKLGEDRNGEFFYNDMNDNKIKTYFKYGEAGTGTAICLITKDSERTFATYLGAAIELDAKDLVYNEFEGSENFFLEGYMVQNHKLVKHSVDLARKAGNKIIIDLASFNVVEENREFLNGIVSEYVDIIFANEEESEAFTGLSDPEEGLKKISELCDIAVVKIGSRGSLIMKNERKYSIKAELTKAVDTTGAGDLYASGFLYGIAKGLPMEKCGNIGSILAREIVETFGAKIDPDRWDSLKEKISEVESL